MKAYREEYSITTSSVANIQARLRAIAEQITTLSSEWTVKQDAVVFDTSYVCLVLSHTSEAEIALASGNTSSGWVNAGNSYLGTIDGQDNYALLISFKPSTSGGSFATIDDTTNPKDTATFCDDAGAYSFKSIYNDTSGGRFYNLDGSVIALVHETYAHVTLILLKSDDKTMFEAIIMRDDESGTSAFQDLISGTDTEESYFAVIRLDQDINSQTFGVEPWEAKISFIKESGSVVENGRLLANTGVLSASYEDTNGEYTREYIKLACNVATYSQGVKGLLAANTHHLIRSSAQPANQTGEDKEWIHLDNGHCIEGGADYPIR